MEKELKELMERVFSFASTRIDVKEISPMFHAVSADNVNYVYAVEMGDEREKDSLVATLRRYFRDNNIIRYVMVSEAYVSREQSMMPREDPNRLDALVVAGADIYGNKLQIIAEIVTADDGKRHLGRREEFATATGRMLSCLDDISANDISANLH